MTCCLHSSGQTPELDEIAERFPKQHRLLRTLIEAEGPVELRDCLRRLNLSDSPAQSLARRGWIRITSSGPRPMIPSSADRTRTG